MPRILSPGFGSFSLASTNLHVEPSPGCARRRRARDPSRVTVGADAHSVVLSRSILNLLTLASSYCGAASQILSQSTRFSDVSERDTSNAATLWSRLNARLAEASVDWIPSNATTSPGSILCFPYTVTIVSAPHSIAFTWNTLAHARLMDPPSASSSNASTPRYSKSDVRCVSFADTSPAFAAD